MSYLLMIIIIATHITLYPMKNHKFMLLYISIKEIIYSLEIIKLTEWTKTMYTFCNAQNFEDTHTKNYIKLSL